MDMSLFESVMRSPNVWTGKDGVDSLDKLLANPGLQDRIQANIIRGSYDKLVATGQIEIPALDSFAPVGEVFTGAVNTNGLVSLNKLLGSGQGIMASTGALSSFDLSNIASGATGLISGATSTLGQLGSININSLTGGLSLEGLGGGLDKVTGSISALANRGQAELGGLLANASKFGVETATEWAKGFTPDALTSQLNTLAKQGQFAINFADFKLPSIASGMAPAAAFKGTIDRSTLDAATAKLIGTTRIPLPEFSPPSEASLNLPSLETAMNSAKSLLSSSSSLLGQAQGLAGGLTSSLSSGLSSAGGLLTQAQTALKAPGGVISIPGLDIGNATQQASSLLRTAQSTLPRLGSTG